MPDANLHLAALDILAGGGYDPAAARDAYIGHWRFSRADYIGGCVSARPVQSLYVERLGSYVRGGIRIDRVGGLCGSGTGTLEAVDATHLRWLAPGETVAGQDVGWSAGIAILEGETRILPSGTGGFKWIRVTRTLSETLWGKETLGLSIMVNNDVAGTVHLVEPDPWADTYIYRAVCLKNNSAFNITNLAITPADSGTYVRNGVITADMGESWADQDTGPVGGNPWVASLSGLSLPVGYAIQLGLRHKSAFIDDGSGGPDETMCTARWQVSAQISYTANGVNNIRDDIWGVNQRGIASLDRYELYGDLNALPVVGDPAYLLDTGATPADLDTSLGAGHTGLDVFYWDILHRDAFGQRSAAKATPYSTTLSESAVVPGAPDDPSLIQVTAIGEGVIRVQAVYDAQFDASGTPATDWLIYMTEDGTDPVPGVTVPTVVNITTYVQAGVAGGGQVVLDWESSGLVDETPAKVIVRMRRTLDGLTLDSSGTTVYSATASWYPIQIRRTEGGEVSGAGWQTGPDDVGETITVSAPNFVYVIAKDFGTELWWLNDCIWSVRHDQWRHSYALSTETISGAAATDDPIEIGTWDAGAKEIFINVAGQHVMLIECVSKTIRAAQFARGGVPHERHATYPIWPCYAHTCFQTYNGLVGKWETPVSVDANGVVTMDVPDVSCPNSEVYL